MWRSLALALSLALVCPPAYAEDAEALIAEGVKLREAAKDEEALARFTRAHQLQPSARARAQMGLAEQALGRWALAETHLKEALAQSTDPWIQKNEAPLRSALDAVAKHLGTLDVRVNVEGAELRIDGALVGKPPLRVEIGEHTLTVSAPGYHEVTRRVAVSSGELARETIQLNPVPASEPAQPPQAPTYVPLPPPPPARDAPRPSPLRPVAVTSMFVGGLFLIGGVVAYALREDKAKNYNNDSACPGLDEPNQPSQCANLVSSTNTLTTLSVVGVSGAFLFGGAGVALWLLSAPTPKSGGVSLRLGPGAGLGVGGSF